MTTQPPPGEAGEEDVLVNVKYQLKSRKMKEEVEDAYP